MENESVEGRLARLETVWQLQQVLLDKLAIAVGGHQCVVEALAQLAGVELTNSPAPPAPPAN
jgi:uncharacterized coiled-coil protein SlyX